ncbi:hypothetical protein M378DRAFT_541441 [Amanita muscaria Koide BX008]|uniref:Uncharacterized protein n=1 Tax=Amanita muscaria (strain Koide BX008) TaxID=946122 RepID=A0A0C2S096_AMAMK|nr:hypothetical protein M378DRAFT_541441 [Amanita muscaria Koide BX008]
MSASASKSPSKSTTRGFSHKRKKSEDEADVQRKRPSTASQLQSVDQEVRDAPSKEAGDGGDPGISIDLSLPAQVPPIIPEQPIMNRGNRDAQSREAGGGVDPDLPIPTKASTVATEIPSITLLQGSSNFQISNTKFTTIGGDATIIQFGDGQFTEIQRTLVRRIYANGQRLTRYS